MKTFFTLLMVVVSLASYASELFIRVNANGNFRVTVMNQLQESNSNIFRFFDLPNGSVSVNVMNKFGNNSIFNSMISLQPNERLAVEINNYGNMTIVSRVNIQVVNWYTTITNNGYGNYPNQNQPYNPNIPYNNNYPGNGNHHGNHGNYGNNDSNFNSLISQLNSESFDSNKVKMAKSYAAGNQLSVDQIRSVMKTMSFDSNRLEFAKYAYDHCYDKQNYSLLRDAFSFSSNYSSLMDYVGQE